MPHTKEIWHIFSKGHPHRLHLISASTCASQPRQCYGLLPFRSLILQTVMFGHFIPVLELMGRISLVISQERSYQMRKLCNFWNFTCNMQRYYFVLSNSVKSCNSVEVIMNFLHRSLDVQISFEVI